MKHLLSFFLMLCALAWADANLTSALYEADKLFNDGNNLAATDYAAAQANWQKAADMMEDTVASNKIENGPVFYNLGNIYFRLGDMGHAIYNYKLAERYMPGDANLVRNLSIARRSRQDKVEIKESTRALNIVFFWHYDLSLSTREKIFLASFALLVFTAICRLFSKRNAINCLLGLFALLTIVTAASICITEYDWKRYPQGVIIAQQVVGRTGYSTSYEPSFAEPLHAGTEFKVKDTRANWLEIQLADGNTTWIPQQEAKLLP